MGKTNESNYGLFVAQYRKYKRISQRELAKQLKITPQHICNVEKQRNPISHDSLCQFIKAINELDKLRNSALDKEANRLLKL